MNIRRIIDRPFQRATKEIGLLRQRIRHDSSSSDNGSGCNHSRTTTVLQLVPGFIELAYKAPPYVGIRHLFTYLTLRA